MSDENDDLTFDVYEFMANETFVSSEHDGAVSDELRLVLGLNGEAGELAEKYKKYIRDGDDTYREQVVDELGDVLWYWAMLCRQCGVSPQTVAEQNIKKLRDRMDRDVIRGSGDQR